MKKNYLFHVILAYGSILNSTINRNTVVINGVEEQILIEVATAASSSGSMMDDRPTRATMKKIN